MTSAVSPTKNCPRCRAVLAADTLNCTCGHRFESEVAGERSSSDLVALAEALYESHLRARLQRAVRIARLAKIDLLRDPRAATRKAQLREAEKEVKLIETQLAVQSARANEARATAARSHVEAENAHPPETTPEPAGTFRAVQNGKAEQTFELLRLQLASEHLRAAQVTGAFQAVQAEKARAVENAVVPTCPGCGNSLAADAKRCDCGYIRPQLANDGGSDFLTAEELAALRRPF